MNVFHEIGIETWRIILESSPYIFAGFLVAGLLYIFIDPLWIGRHLGKGKVRPVLLSALFGVPLPLCSCGVVPTALSLRRQGANDGAVVSFLISTPETGVDSISITYALMGPVMAIVRPVAAFITAVFAGITTNLFGWRKDLGFAVLPAVTCRVDGCCTGPLCSGEGHEHHSFLEKFRAGMRYAFGELLDDVAGWMAFGFLLAGMIGVFVPQAFVREHLGSGWIPMLVMLAVGVPMYMCATASTPIAAALMMKGLSPGAALVFLLAGPATNVASLTVVAASLGRRVAGIYLSGIVICSLLIGYGLDLAVGAAGVQVLSARAETVDLPAWIEWPLALLLSFFMARSVGKALRKRFGGKARRGRGRSEGEHRQNGH